MTDQEKLDLVRESLQYVRGCIKQTIETNDVSHLSGTLIIIGLLDGSEDAKATFGPSETNET